MRTRSCLCSERNIVVSFVKTTHTCTCMQTMLRWASRAGAHSKSCHYFLSFLSFSFLEFRFTAWVVCEASAKSDDVIELCCTSPNPNPALPRPALPLLGCRGALVGAGEGWGREERCSSRRFDWKRWMREKKSSLGTVGAARRRSFCFGNVVRWSSIRELCRKQSQYKRSH